MLKEIKKGIIIALSFALTLGLIGVTYAAYQSWTIDVNSGDVLAADNWNKMQNNQTDFDTRLSALETSQENWINATLQNSWVGASSSYTYNIPGYYKDSNGRVWLRGGLKGGTNGSCGFTLPIGYRPLVPVSGLSSAWNSGADAQTTRIGISTDGCVGIYQESNQDANTNMSVDNISFSTH